MTPSFGARVSNLPAPHRGKAGGDQYGGLGSLAASCHASHAIDRGATLAEVQTTLGHANVATTSGYLHARPNTSSGLKLDEGIFQ